MQPLQLLLALSALALAAGHASMAVPPPRSMNGKPIDCKKTLFGQECNAGCTEDNCLWYQVGCLVGCDDCSLDGKEMYPTPYAVHCKVNGTPVAEGPTPFPVPRTLPKEALTWNMDVKSTMGDFTAYMPWGAPGASAVVDPCGVASGFGAGKYSGAVAPKGYSIGDLGSQVLKPLANATVVRAGGLLEAGFGFEVNHGGGFSYRLCPADSPLTEECFQAHPLEFASPNHTIRWVDGSKPDLPIPAMTVSQGTVPAGSQWRRVPIPACNCDLGEGCYYDRFKKPEKGDSLAAYEQQKDAPKRCPTGTQFPPPADDLYGYGDVPSILVLDQLRIPADYNGDYVLSWRWDCEQTPQVWNTCADIHVV